MSMQNKISLNIGIDFGGVLSVHDKKTTDGSEHKNVCIDMPHSFEALKTLKLAGHKLFLISFCGKTRALETQEAILDQAPGLFDGMYFVKSKDHKKYMCQHLQCDVMIDDTLSILMSIYNHYNDHTIPLIWFKGDPTVESVDMDIDENNDKVNVPENIFTFRSWKDIVLFCEKLNRKTTLLPDKTLNIKSKIYLV
jgi:hypothetical protein